jgi:hypothetical protein
MFVGSLSITVTERVKDTALFACIFFVWFGKESSHSFFQKRSQPNFQSLLETDDNDS